MRNSAVRTEGVKPGETIFQRRQLFGDRDFVVTMLAIQLSTFSLVPEWQAAARNLGGRMPRWSCTRDKALMSIFFFFIFLFDPYYQAVGRTWQNQ